MTCEQARGDLVAFVNGEVTGRARERMEEHLAACAACRKSLEAARRVLGWTAAASEEATRRIVDETLQAAIAAGASDIHLEPQRDNTLLVRYRVDGVLHEARRLDEGQRAGVVARIKMLADMNVAETRLPNDGRLPFTDGERQYDLRVSSVPYVFGEKLVLRILDRCSVLIGLDQLGLHADDREALRRLAREPNGLLVVTGPTGSGKTTTLYSLMSEVNRGGANAVSIEDPVEYLLDGVNQAQVNVKAGFTFGVALRSFMRQDPDVILVGEVRSLEDGELCIQAAITGHLVMTCLHTRDAVSAIQRMRDVGLEPYLTGAVLIGIAAQRLVRRICPDCKEPWQADPREPVVRGLGITPEDLAEHTLYAGRGCEHCRQTGYRGRTALFEVLTIDRDIAAMVGNADSVSDIAAAAAAKGFRTMREDGRRKVLDGVTTAREVMRVLSGLV